MSNIKDKICLICIQDIPDVHHNITDNIQPNLNAYLTIYQFLQSVSNFNKLDISEVPQNVCEHCQSNISQMYCFQMLCNRSVENLQRIKEKSIKDANKQKDNVIVISYVDEDDETPSKNMNLISEGNDYFNEDSVSLEGVNPIENADEANLPSKPVKNVTIIDYNEKIECPHCNISCLRADMKEHKKTHIGERLYKCDLCPRTFSGSGSLQYHMNVHLDQRPFLCTVCGAQFRRKAHLELHLRKHTNVRPYPCKICGKSFKSSAMMQEHISVHSDARPFACEECPKTFRLRKHLRQHMITHAEIKPIECIHCGKRFTQKQNLRAHQAKSCQGPKDNVDFDLVPE